MENREYNEALSIRQDIEFIDRAINYLNEKPTEYRYYTPAYVFQRKEDREYGIGALNVKMSNPVFKYDFNK